MEKKLTTFIRDALLGEVYATPKPGLVDLHDSGAHTDMDVHTFEKSTEAIVPYLLLMYKTGVNSVKDNVSGPEAFRLIRGIGMDAERAMFAATDGVNTHKGMIFTMGIVLTAYGIVEERQAQGQTQSQPQTLQHGQTQSQTHDQGHTFGQITIDDVLDTARQMTREQVEADFALMKDREARTHGERLYKNYGERGIRGQAAEGFPIIREVAYPAVMHYAKLSDCATATAVADTGMPNIVKLDVLLSIMESLNDTNVVTRSSYETMEQLKRDAASILKLGGAATTEGMEKLEKLNEICIDKNISPGGAADILAVTILLYKLLEESAYNRNNLH